MRAPDLVQPPIRVAGHAAACLESSEETASPEPASVASETGCELVRIAQKPERGGQLEKHERPPIPAAAGQRTRACEGVSASRPDHQGGLFDAFRVLTQEPGNSLLGRGVNGTPASSHSLGQQEQESLGSWSKAAEATLVEAHQRLQVAGRCETRAAEDPVRVDIHLQESGWTLALAGGEDEQVRDVRTGDNRAERSLLCPGTEFVDDYGPFLLGTESVYVSVSLERGVRPLPNPPRGHRLGETLEERKPETRFGHDRQPSMQAWSCAKGEGIILPCRSRVPPARSGTFDSAPTAL